MNPSEPRHAALKPDARLDAYFSGEDERRRVTRELFDQAGAGYDEAGRITGFGTGPRYRREVLQRNGLGAGMHLLDVAAGTGLVTVAAVELVGPQGRVLALDPSPGMLAELRRKVDVETIEGYAEAIPLPDAHVDFISMGYALRHVGDLDQAFSEYLRVLRPGGHAYGDQCENCGSSLSPTELISPKSVLTGTVPVLKKTKHWYLPLNNYEAWLKDWLNQGTLA